MSCKNVQILNFNHNIVEVGPDNKIVITDQIKCNSITIPQPVTNILQINSPGPQGITGPQGEQGIQGTANTGGNSGTIQYNNSNNFDGVSTLTYDGSSLVTATNIKATGVFAEYITSTTVGNTDPETAGIPTDLTITQSGTYIITDIYTGITGYIYFPDPTTHTGEKIRIQNRDRFINADIGVGSYGRPQDIGGNQISLISTQTTKLFISDGTNWLEI